MSSRPRLMRTFLALATIASVTTTVGVGIGGASARGTIVGHVRASAAVTGHGITVSPTVELVDGIIRGNLHATTTTGRTLRYDVIGSSAGGKMDIGTVPTSAGATTTDPQSFTVLPYATWLETGAARGSQTFTVRVRPVAGSGLSEKASLKRSVTVDIVVDVNALAPANTPIAFTQKVVSFDGTLISANFFPRSGLAAGQTADTLLSAPKLGHAGETNPYTPDDTESGLPGMTTMTADSVMARGFNVVTWDPRGTFASEGFSQLGNPFFDGRDVTSLIDWVASSTPTTMNGTNDPAVGVLGASLGGVIAMTSAGTDPRVDAIVPAMTWFSLDDALHPTGIFRSRAATSLVATMTAAGNRLNTAIVSGIAEGARTGVASGPTRAALSSTGPSALLHQLQAPTYLIQSSNDPVNRLGQATTIASTILDNPYGTPVKMAVFNPKSAHNDAIVAELAEKSLMWVRKYVSGVPIPDAYTPIFQWWDQHGTRHVTASANNWNSAFPFSPGFNGATPATGTSTGGLLVVPSKKKIANSTTRLEIPVTLPQGADVVGAPTVTFTYQGKGTRRAVFARVVEKGTGRVLGPITTPIPVTLDGAQHTVSVMIAEIVHSASTDAERNLVIQIIGASKSFPKRGGGRVAISNISVAVPVVAVADASS